MDASVRAAITDATIAIERRRNGFPQARKPVAVYRGEPWSVPMNDHGWVELHDWEWSWPKGEDTPFVDIIGTTVVTTNGNQVAYSPADFPAQHLTDIEDEIRERLMDMLEEQAREIPSERDTRDERDDWEYHNRRDRA